MKYGNRRCALAAPGGRGTPGSRPARVGDAPRDVLQGAVPADPAGRHSEGDQPPEGETVGLPHRSLRCRPRGHPAAGQQRSELRVVAVASRTRD